MSKPGKIFIDQDYEQLEVHVFADDAGDEPLISAMKKGHDIYSAVGIDVNNIGHLYSADKKADNYLKLHAPGLRQGAKQYTLGIRYGLKEFKLAHDLNLSEDACKEIIENYLQDDILIREEFYSSHKLESLFDWQQAASECIIASYFNKFPNLKAAMDHYKNCAITAGKVQARPGRIRHLPKAPKIYRKYGEDLLDPLKSRQIAKKHEMPLSEIKSLRKQLTAMINNAYNFPIQSMAASIVNRAAIAIAREFKKLGIDAKIVAQVHDQLIIECVEDQKDKAAAISQKLMETTYKLKHLDLKAPPAFSHNFKDGH